MSWYKHAKNYLELMKLNPLTKKKKRVQETGFEQALRSNYEGGDVSMFDLEASKPITITAPSQASTGLLRDKKGLPMYSDNFTKPTEWN